MRIAREMLDEIVSHALEDRPNECCGMVGGDGGRAVSVHRARNSEASPYGFVIDSQDQFRIMSRIEEDGQEVVAIYHSHTRSPAEPSERDRNDSQWWPGVTQIIVSVADPDAPTVRAWNLDDGKVAEVELETG